MAWQEVETDVGPKVGRVRYSVSQRQGGARVSLPKHVVEQLGWKKTTMFRLLVGGGDLDGKLRLEPADKGRIKAITGWGRGDGYVVRLGRWQGLAPRDVDSVPVEHEIEKPALIITLPRHAQMAAPEPRTAAAAAPTVPTTTGRVGVPTAAKRDVTSQFFDDPKEKRIGMASGTRGGR